ncbi:MAG: hypothetical protein OEQ53_07010 [Saprospiraceae bacterium]|nr:hypothetical protein [Saprospiraceae bacterium]
MTAHLFSKSLLGAFLLTALFGLSNILFNFSHSTFYYLWSFLANFLVTLVLGYYAINSTLVGLKLSVSLFLIYFLIGNFNILIEALIFNVTDQAETIKEVFNGFCTILVFSPFFVYLLGKWKSIPLQINSVPRSIFNWIWRIVVAYLLYLFVYLLAGFILQTAYPPLMTFYEDKIPPVDLIFQTQILRALIFAGITILILKTTDLKIFIKAILIGVVFSILGGVAPLIPPNEFMPYYIRLGHFFEVGISNFIYGFLVAYLLSQKKQTG